MIDNVLELEEVTLIFRNFVGKASTFNPQGGVRTFGVVLDIEAGNELKRDGWNIKTLKPQEDGDEPTCFLPVAVNFDGPYPPRIFVKNSRNKLVQIPADEMDTVDTARIISADVVVRPYNYNVNGSRGVKAYLQTLYLVLEPSKLREKYENMAELEEDEAI